MEFADDGSGLATIARAKGDPEGRGTHHYLAHDTVAALRAWRDAAWPSERPDRRETVFRGLSAWGRGVRQTPLNSGSVIEIFRRLGRLIELPDDTVERIGGHSLRIGCAQDLREQGFGLLEIMQAGRWKQPEMAKRYTERIAAKEQAIRKLAVALNRQSEFGSEG